ncbi:MAG: MFS transporter [Sphingomonadales bacterium]
MGGAGGRTAGNQRYRVDVFLLFLAQALFMASAIGFVIFGALTGVMLATNPAIATLPLALFAVGSAVIAVPMSFLMKRWGRRRGFLIAIMAGLVGAMLACLAIYMRSFGLFCLATTVMGAYQAGAQFYRFAATEVTPAHYQPRAISYVIAGGIVAAILGPVYFNTAEALFAPVTFIGAFVGMAALNLVAVAPVSLVAFRDRGLTESGVEQRLDGPGRPLQTIVRQPIFLAAIANGAGSFIMMSMMMTAAPLAIVACGFAPSTAAYVMQWHMLAMTAPAFIAGPLIQRFGVVSIMLAALGLYMTSALIALGGITIGHFGVSMAMMGLAWCFMFTGATHLLVQSHTVAERAKVQGVNDAVVFGMAAAASLLSGALHAWSGWTANQYAVLLVGGGVGTVTLWYYFKEKQNITVSS